MGDKTRNKSVGTSAGRGQSQRTLNNINIVGRPSENKQVDISEKTKPDWKKATAALQSNLFQPLEPVDSSNVLVSIFREPLDELLKYTNRTPTTEMLEELFDLFPESEIRYNISLEEDVVGEPVTKTWGVEMKKTQNQDLKMLGNLMKRYNKEIQLHDDGVYYIPGE